MLHIAPPMLGQFVGVVSAHSFRTSFVMEVTVNGNDVGGRDARVQTLDPDFSGRAGIRFSF